MRSEPFRDLLQERWQRGFFLCVGLDSALEKLPLAVQGDSASSRMFAFNRAIVDATRDVVFGYKPNSAFYEAQGAQGIEALRDSIRYIHETAPELPVILDAKRADIGNTNDGYVRFAFDYLEADAITLHPYLGCEALQPFLERKEKGLFVLCRTSNTGAGEFQDLKVDGEELYKVIARRVAKDWDSHSNCGLVVGATYPDELRTVRQLAPRTPFLIPGIGAQDGDLQKTVEYGKDEQGYGMVIAASRSIIFASSGADFADAARKEVERLNGEIKKYV